MKGYRFLEEIGQGAFSRVWLAEDPNGRRWACKISEQRRLLQREASYLEKIKHPLFPEYHEYTEQEERGYLFQEYIEGKRLAEWVSGRVEDTGRPGEQDILAEVLNIWLQLADGLTYLQEQEPALVYRDLKPDNILITPEGNARLVDLGLICPVGIAGSRGGSPGFASPEQFEQGGILTERSDVYALGKVMEWMGKELGLSNEKSFRKGYRTRGYKMLENLIRRCTAKEAQERLTSMRLLLLILKSSIERADIATAGEFPKAVLCRKIQVMKMIVRQENHCIGETVHI